MSRSSMLQGVADADLQHFTDAEDSVHQVVRLYNAALRRGIFLTHSVIT